MLSLHNLPEGFVELDDLNQGLVGRKSVELTITVGVVASDSEPEFLHGIETAIPLQDGVDFVKQRNQSRHCEGFVEMVELLSKRMS